MSFTSVTLVLTSYLNFKYLLYEKVTIHFSIPKTPELSFLSHISRVILKVGSFFWDTLYIYLSVLKRGSSCCPVNVFFHSGLAFTQWKLHNKLFSEWPSDFISVEIQSAETGRGNSNKSSKIHKGNGENGIFLMTV